MDKINQISDIIILSLEFDNLLQKNKFCELENCANKIKMKINAYKSTSSNKTISPEINMEITSILSKIDKVNEYTIKHFIDLCKIHNSNPSVDESNLLVVNNIPVVDTVADDLNKMAKYKESNNTMILFYSPDCVYCRMFYPEWKKLKLALNNKVNMIAINCKKADKQEICDYFKIDRYPTLKYVTPTKIHDYYGNMNMEEILKTFMLD